MNDHFLPSADRATALRAAVDRQLRHRLQQVLDVHAQGAAFPTTVPPAHWVASALDHAALFDLRRAQDPASTVQARLAGESAFRWLQQRMASEPPARPAAADLRVATLSELFHTPSECTRLQRCFNADGRGPFPMEGVGPSRLMMATSELRQAWCLLGEVAPALRDEMAALSPEVLLVRSATATSHGFHSVSTAELWGCMALNVETHASAWDFFASLVRESARSLLQALATQQPLVASPAPSRMGAPSPQQASATNDRLQAAFVAAREADALRRATAHPGTLHGDGLDPQHTRLQTRLRQCEEAFHTSAQPLARSAHHLTPLGTALWRDAGRHIAAVHAPPHTEPAHRTASVPRAPAGALSW